MSSRTVLVKYRKELRARPTPEEVLLSEAIRASFTLKKHSKHTCNQIIGPYIVDLVFPHRMLVVELDGSQHVNSTKYDAKRTKFLERFGFAVLRFANGTVRDNMDGVLAEIARYPCAYSYNADFNRAMARANATVEP